MYNNSNNFSFNISDEMNKQHFELTSAITLAKHSLYDYLICKVFESFNEKLQMKNAVLFYEIGVKFNRSDLNITVLRYIERCFSMIVETESFLELDFKTISKILASSSLQIDSEVEVYNAANKWLNHNIEERSKYARKLLLKVRLDLLSDDCLKYLLSESSCISKNNDCLEVLKNINSFSKSTVHNKTRQCNQNMSKVLICGGYDSKKEESIKLVKEVCDNKFKEHKDLPSMLEKRRRFKVVYLKGEVYVFGGIGFGRNPLKSVEKYSPVKKGWSHVCDLPDERHKFCVCAFMDKIYIFSGHSYLTGSLNSCFELDPKKSTCKQIAKMNEVRKSAACEVFEGNVVVSGGYDYYNHENFKSVEFYDVFANTWTPMPSMNERRCCHSLVCVKSKLFAIGGAALDADCEIFDKISNMFVTLETPNFHTYILRAVSIGSRIFVLHDSTQVVLCYDVDKDEWTEESCKAIENISYYSSVIVPLY